MLERMDIPFRQDFLTHKNCVNFQNGKCKLYNIVVAANGLNICPNFTPRFNMRAARRHLGSYSQQTLKLIKGPIRLPHIHEKIKLHPTKWCGRNQLFPPFLAPLQFISAEIKVLEAYREDLKDEIEALNARIKELRLVRSHNQLIF
jgi:hypothetical protein